MGFISDEWIDPGVKTRDYAVAEVRLVGSRPTSEFSKRHGLVMRLQVEKASSRRYQVLHFDSTDLLHFLACSLREAGPGLRAEILAAMLGETSDDELVSTLDMEISRRRPRKEVG